MESEFTKTFDKFERERILIQTKYLNDLVLWGNEFAEKNKSLALLNLNQSIINHNKIKKMITTKRIYSIDRLRRQKITPTDKQIARELKSFYWYVCARISPFKRRKQNELNDDNN